MTQIPERPTRQILVAGIGNAWMKDDGFGSEVVKVLSAQTMPDGVSVVDFGTGGLDLAYEVMRGYDGWVLVGISRPGEPPGTLYVMEADPADVDGSIEDGQALDPHGMDPETVLRFAKYVGGGPGRGVVVAPAGRNTAGKHADGRRVKFVSVQTGALRQVVPESLRFYWEIVARDTECEGAALELVEVQARLRCRDCDREWTPELPVFRCPGCAGAAVDVAAGDELSVDYIEVEE